MKPLACRYHLQGKGVPIVFLHGFLGSGEDWQSVIAHLAPQQNWLVIDLPGHGASQQVSLAPEAGFQSCCELIARCLTALSIKQCHLVGYSLGGRIALHFLHTYPERVIQLVLESAHPGLTLASEKAARLRHDQEWAQRFMTQPLPQVLQHWYQQTVFADLSATSRQYLCQRRSDNLGPALAQMLLATSLAKQADLQTVIRNTACPISYFCAEQDTKFSDIATRLKKSAPLLNKISFTEAGHNIHFAKPIEYANQLSRLLCR